MFRVILWKEWRELWLLPAVAAPLASLGVFLAFIWQEYELTGWEMGFGVWLPVAAVFIPVALFARKEERESPGFLPLRPLDRFRLWWMKIAVAIALFALVGGILYVVTLCLDDLLETTRFDVDEGLAFRTLIRLSVMLFCFSALSSGFFKKPLTAFMGSLLISFLFWGFAFLFALVVLGFDEIRMLDLMPMCPFLLFFSLVAFARDNLFRRTPLRMALGYGASAVIAMSIAAIMIAPDLSPIRTLQVAKAVSNSYMQTKRMFADWLRASKQRCTEKRKPVYQHIRILDASSDGSRLLVQVLPASLVLFVDLAQRKTQEIERVDLGYAAFDPIGKTIVYCAWERGFSAHWRIAMSDTQGKRRELCEDDEGFSSFMWSPDGKFGAVVRYSEPPQIMVFNSDGDLEGKLELPPLERDAEIHPVGWDAHEMFYYRRLFRKRESFDATSWRMSRKDMKPASAILPPERWSGYDNFSLLSPDGRWLADFDYQNCNLTIWRLGTEEIIELCSASAEDGFDWSRDGARLAYMGTIQEITQVIFLNLHTEESVPCQFQELPGPMPYWLSPGRSWSPSNKYLLLWGGQMPYAFSVETHELRQFPELAPRDEFDDSNSHWISGDRLVCVSGRKLLAAEVGGAAWKEIFRIENGEFIFDGNVSND
ncbi:MAG: hypothetical protein Kow0099_19460 [Candidatus Abyssubacteria bacterium]